MNAELVKQNEAAAPRMVVVDMNDVDLPDLSDADVLPMELTTFYWTPEKADETKRVYFDCIKFREMPAIKEGEEPQILPCAHFYEKVDGEMMAICNASKRLVAAIEGSFVKRGTPLIITYKGKRKNATNQFQSDSWSIKPLIPKGLLIENHVADQITAKANVGDEIGFDETPAAEVVKTTVKATPDF